MKSIETDNRLVDYLFDELGHGDPESLRAELTADAETAKQVSSYEALLKIYRREAEEISPSADATEKILAEARRVSQPWYTRLFGQRLFSAMLRPAVGIAAMAVLVLGFGVFLFHSGSGSSDRSRGDQSRMAADSDRKAAFYRPEETSTGAAAAAPARAPGLLAMDEESRELSGELDSKGDQTAALALAAMDRRDEGLDSLGEGQDSLIGAGPSSLRRGQARNQEKQEIADGSFSDSSKARAPGGAGARKSASAYRATGGQEQPAGMSAAALKAMPSKPSMKKMAPVDKAAEERSPRAGFVPQSSAEAVSQGGQSKDARTRAGSTAYPRAVSQTAKRQVPPTTQSAPALYNQARTSLNRGQVAEACDLFASLVRTHRDNPRRPDALLGWARCEMARGAYGKAETIIQTLIKDHPDWRKSGDAWIAEVRRQRQQAVLRAQQRAQRQRRATKSAPDRAQSRPRARPKAPSSVDSGN